MSVRQIEARTTNPQHSIQTINGPSRLVATDGDMQSLTCAGRWLVDLNKASGLSPADAARGHAATVSAFTHVRGLVCRSIYRALLHSPERLSHTMWRPATTCTCRHTVTEGRLNYCFTARTYDSAAQVPISSGCCRLRLARPTDVAVLATCSAVSGVVSVFICASRA